MAKANGHFKTGDRVKWTRKSGLPDKGTVLRLNNTPSGPWYEVKARDGTTAVLRPATIRKG